MAFEPACNTRQNCWLRNRLHLPELPPMVAQAEWCQMSLRLSHPQHTMLAYDGFQPRPINQGLSRFQEILVQIDRSTSP